MFLKLSIFINEIYYSIKKRIKDLKKRPDIHIQWSLSVPFNVAVDFIRKIKQASKQKTDCMKSAKYNCMSCLRVNLRELKHHKLILKVLNLNKKKNT